MRQLVLQMQITVDGFVAGPKAFGDDATAWIVDRAWQAGAHLMGSRTFADMAAYWPTSTEPVAPPMNEIPKVVFSASRNRTEHGVGTRPVPPSVAESWARPQIATGDLGEEIDRLKRQPGKEILAHGGAGFARSLARAGLVDEYRLLVHPVALGRGLPLFSDLPKALDLTLVSSQRFAAGIVAQVYRPVRP